MPENFLKTDLINQLVGARECGERPVAPRADLRGADLYGADLYGADLRDADTLSDGACGGTRYFTTGDGGAFARTAALMLRRDISRQLHCIEPFDKGPGRMV